MALIGHCADGSFGDRLRTRVGSIRVDRSVRQLAVKPGAKRRLVDRLEQRLDERLRSERRIDYRLWPDRRQQEW